MVLLVNTDFECALLIFAVGFLMSFETKAEKLPSAKYRRRGYLAFAIVIAVFVLFAVADLLDKIWFALGIPGTPVI